MRCSLALVLGVVACDGSQVIDPQPPPGSLDPANRDSLTLRLELFVDDVGRSVGFYTGVMGFTLDPGATADYAVVRANTIQLGLQSVDGVSGSHYFRPELTSQRRGLGTEIVFEVDDIDNYFAAVTSTGTPLTSPLTQRPWGAIDFRLADPDGYYLRPTSR